MAVERVREGQAPGAVIASYDFCRTTIYKWLRHASNRGRGISALAARNLSDPCRSSQTRRCGDLLLGRIGLSRGQCAGQDLGTDRPDAGGARARTAPEHQRGLGGQCQGGVLVCDIPRRAQWRVVRGTVSRVIQISPVRVIKNSPPGLSGRRRFLQSHQSCFEFLFQPIGMASDIDGDRMMEHPIQNRGRQDQVPKHLAPGPEALITRE